jgi:hypothetical protein
MHNTNNMVVDYLFCALCKSEFYRLYAKDLSCKIWDKLKVAHDGNNQVKARMFVTYRREYENFTHLSCESIDIMFQRFTMIVNNMRASVTMLPYDDNDRVVKLQHLLDRTVWGRKVEAILESSSYRTLTVDELFSMLK